MSLSLDKPALLHFLIFTCEILNRSKQNMMPRYPRPLASSPSGRGMRWRAPRLPLALVTLPPLAARLCTSLGVETVIPSRVMSLLLILVCQPYHTLSFTSPPFLSSPTRHAACMRACVDRKKVNIPPPSPPSTLSFHDFIFCLHFLPSFLPFFPSFLPFFPSYLPHYICYSQ